MSHLGHPCFPRVLVTGLLCIGTGAGGGCGTSFYGVSPREVLLRSSCDGSGLSEADRNVVVVLDWTGGHSPIYAHQELTGLEWKQFSTDDDGSLADAVDLFQELVRQEVARILCEYPGMSVAVVNGEDDVEGRHADTIVHLTQEVRPDGKMDIGQGEYDPCDAQDDNSAIVFGKRILDLGNGYPLEEWVRILANVTAHEIGHTLGFGHVLREQRPEPERSLFVELMLDRHTMSEMRRPQRFIADQTNCPDSPGGLEFSDVWSSAAP